MRLYLMLALVLWFQLGCNKPPSPAPNSASAADAGAIRVKTVQPKKQQLTWIIEQPGKVEPLEITPIVVKLPGYIKSSAPDTAALKAHIKLPGGQPAVIDIGSEVEAGQLLATLDIPELEAELLEKKALLLRAQADKALEVKQLAVTEAQVNTAISMVSEAEAAVVRAETDVVRWKAELDQVNSQISGGVGETQTRNVVTKSWEAAKAAKLESEAKVITARTLILERKSLRDRAAAAVDTAQARIEVASADLDRTKALVGYTRITAPFPGIITERTINTGNFMQPGMGNQNSTLFTVARIDVLRVFVDIPEDSADKADVGTPVVVSVPILGRDYNLTVTRTTRVLNANNRTLRIEIDVDNADRKLKVGAYVVARINATSDATLALPSGCILAADETHYVYLVENGRAVKYRVQVGHTSNGAIQVHGRRKASRTGGAWEPFTGTEQVVLGNLGALADDVVVKPE